MSPLLDQRRSPSCNGACVVSAFSASACSPWAPESQSVRTGARAHGGAGPCLIRFSVGAGLV